MSPKIAASNVTLFATANWISLKTPDGARIVVTTELARELLDQLPVLVAQSDMLAGRPVTPPVSPHASTAQPRSAYVQ